MLSEPRVTRLREAITTRLRDPSHPDDELRLVLREVATEARSRSLRPEELIVALKKVMSEIEIARLAHSVEEPRRLQEWLVTTCIQVYYDPEQTGPRDPS